MSYLWRIFLIFILVRTFGSHKDKKDKMVEQTRQPSRVIGLQAGPGDVNLRIDDRAVRTIGRQLAVIGDRLDREWTNRLPNQWPTALHMPRPAQVLTRTIYREIQRQVWDFQGFSTAVKTWLEPTTQGIFRAEAWLAWVSSIQPVTSTGWTAATLVTMAVVATATICTAFWVEWRG